MYRVDSARSNVIVVSGSAETVEIAWNEYEQLYYPGRARTYLRVLDELDKNKPVEQPRLLDVGSALGWFMEMATERGYKTWGIEQAEDVASMGHRRSGRPVQIALLENAPYPDQFFHVVSLFDVLEHTIDPVVCLEEAKRLLTTDGLLIVRVPDMDGLLPRVSHWLELLTLGRYSHPVHLLWRFHRWGFNRRSLEILLRKAGFGVLTVYGEDAQDLSCMSHKRWAHNPITVAGVKAIIHLSHVLGMRDEVVMIVRVNSHRR